MNDFDRELAILTSYASGAVDWAYLVCQQTDLSPDVVFSWSDEDLMRAIVSLRWKRIVDQAHSIASAEPIERGKLRVRAMKRGIDGRRAAKLSRTLQ